MARIYEFGGFRLEYRTDDFRITVDGQPSECDHKKLILNEKGETVTCSDCGLQVTAWWALLELVHNYEEARDKLLALIPPELRPKPKVIPEQGTGPQSPVVMPRRRVLPR